MKNVNLKSFFDEEIWPVTGMESSSELENRVSLDNNVVDVHIGGSFVNQISDEELIKLENLMGEKLVSVKRTEHGIDVVVLDKDDGNQYNLTWGDFGYYYDFQGITSYVKIEELMMLLYKKFGEAYHDEYLKFCNEVAAFQLNKGLSEFDKTYSHGVAQNNIFGKKTTQKRELYAKFLEDILDLQVQEQMNYFNKAISYKKDKRPNSSNPGQMGE